LPWSDYAPDTLNLHQSSLTSVTKGNIHTAICGISEILGDLSKEEKEGR
jgi:hypothetical protein